MIFGIQNETFHYKLQLFIFIDNSLMTMLIK